MITFILGIIVMTCGGVVLVAKGSIGSSYASFFAWSLVLFGTARMFRSDPLAEIVDRICFEYIGAQNISTLLGMLFGTLGAVPLLCICAVITGGSPPSKTAVATSISVIAAGMSAAFLSTDLSVTQSEFISKDVPVTGGVAVYWAFFLAPIATAASYTAFNAGRLLRWTTPGPWRVLLSGVAWGGLFGLLYTIHKVVVLLIKLVNSDSYETWVIRTAPSITLALGFLAMGGYGSAMAVWLLQRLPRQIRAYRSIRLQSRTWKAARRSAPKYLLDPRGEVPTRRRDVWREARSPERERQMRVEIADSAFTSNSSSSD
jgi:hypothetical protein